MNLNDSKPVSFSGDIYSNLKNNAKSYNLQGFTLKPDEIYDTILYGE